MPLNPKVSLVANTLDSETVAQEPTRKGYGQGLLETGEKDPRVVALCADLTETTPLTMETIRSILMLLTSLPSRPCRDGSFFLPLTMRGLLW